MIYDCFIFNQEQELLDIRMNELRDLPVIHVIVEATHTFTGIKKPQIRPITGERIRHIIVEDMPNNGNTWDNETHQRNAIMRGLHGLNGDDIVIISDCDEIPKAYCVNQYRPEYGMVALQMDMYSYYLNCLQGRQSWNMARIMPYNYLMSRTPDLVRRSGFLMTIYEAGWHFTFQGGVYKMMEKFRSFSHQEEGTQRLNNQEILERKMELGESLWSDHKWEFVTIDDRFPDYIRNNPTKFKHMIR
jgi:beta-1,4-mannosyl-glycoprotein beta-1,4-N-acetylglucosaminyltransferase